MQKAQIHLENALRLTIALLFLIGCSQWSFAQQEMWMSSTDANIIKRAAKQPKPLFQLSIGHSHVESMQQLEGNLLFIGLRKTTPQLKSSEYMMVHSETGEVLWRWPCEKGDYSTFWITENQVILKKEDGKKTTLFALDKKKGRQTWTKSFKKGKMEFIVAPEQKQWITYAFEKDKIALEGFALETGTSLWSTEWAEAFDGVPFVLLDDEALFVFKETITALDVVSGQKKYTVNHGRVQNDSYLLPTFDSEYLYFIDANQNLKAIQKSDGTMLWETPFADSITGTNISTTETNLYVRMEKGQGFRLVKVYKETGEIRWDTNFTEVLTSNILEFGQRTYVGSASSLYTLDSQTGEVQSKNEITEVGQSFPTALRLADSTVVFVGELAIAGFDSQTGKQRYRHGFSPIHPGLHLNGLDALLPRLTNDLAQINNVKLDNSASTMASNQSAYYQKMADKSYSDYLKYRREGLPGSSYRTNMARHRSRMYSGMARMQAGLDLSYSILEMGAALQQMLLANAAEAEIRKQEYHRKSILEVYQNALKEETVFRPSDKFYAQDDNYNGVSLIDLASGEKQDVMVSPKYREYGLWNLIDTEKRIIYHHGVGMDPKKYKLSKSRVAPLVSFKFVETFLIAQPY
ncbi:MAG: PQQ-binding-like beta-propeller repeat protein [Bacteroidota bacterium]